MPKAKMQFSEHFETTPGFMPDSLTDVATSTVWIKEIHITNVSASAVTFTIQDKQGTPLLAFDEYSLSAGETFSNAWEALQMPGGFSWVASAANALATRCRYSK